MRVLVCGSRTWTDEWPIRDLMQRLMLQSESPHVTIVHGAAHGADQIAAKYAAIYEHAVEAHPANWVLWGKRAGVIRNLEMLDSHIDRVYAFRADGESRGTDHTIRVARRRGIPVEVITGRAS